MVREFTFNEGCVVVDNVRMPTEVARALVFMVAPSLAGLP